MLRGGAPRVVWQALGADPRQTSAGSAAQRLARDGRPPHLVWNPLSGDIVQLIPVVRAACSLGGPEGLDHRVSAGADGADDTAPGGDPANRQGRLCVQVCAVAWAWEPFTDGPMHGAGALLDWLASWGVPSRWPAGRPAPFMAARSAERSRTHWSMGGHFGASQVPGWDAAGPGHIEPALLGGAVTPACAVPPGRGVAGRRPTLTAAPAAISRGRRMALETVITPDIDSVASVASLANAPY
jgi:hypothetical protein